MSDDMMRAAHDTVDSLSAPKPLPPGDGWQPISTAAEKAVWVEVWNGKQVIRAHFACDLSGDEQPPFRGWFRENGDSGFIEISPRPTHWRTERSGLPHDSEKV